MRVWRATIPSHCSTPTPVVLLHLARGQQPRQREHRVQQPLVGADECVQHRRQLRQLREHRQTERRPLTGRARTSGTLTSGTLTSGTLDRAGRHEVREAGGYGVGLLQRCGWDLGGVVLLEVVAGPVLGRDPNPPHDPMRPAVPA
jgi:hypothetical protein